MSKNQYEEQAARIIAQREGRPVKRVLEPAPTPEAEQHAKNAESILKRRGMFAEPHQPDQDEPQEEQEDQDEPQEEQEDQDEPQEEQEDQTEDEVLAELATLNKDDLIVIVENIGKGAEINKKTTKPDLIKLIMEASNVTT